METIRIDMYLGMDGACAQVSSSRHAHILGYSLNSMCSLVCFRIVLT